MAHHQITREERLLIEHYVKKRMKISHIAHELHRAVSTITDEIKRNSICFEYSSEIAQYHAEKRKSMANAARAKITSGSALERFIFDKLRVLWSPEDIPHELLTHQILPYVSAKTIYAFIERVHPEFTRYLLLKKHKRRTYKAGKKYLIPNRTWIDERPKEVDLRKTPGHWENDTLVSGCRKKAIATSTERVSGYLLAAKMETREAQNLNRALIRVFADLPQKMLKSCTNDNGPEFAAHETLSKTLHIKVYFAHPYHAWERPVNENANRYLRHFFPKGTRFSDIEPWELDRAVNIINNKPRKRLNYHTPAEVFHSFLK